MPDNRDGVLRHALDSSLVVVRAAAARATPEPRVGDVWRVRWDDAAGAVLVMGAHVAPDVSGALSTVRVAPIGFGDEPDDSALFAPALTHDLGVDLAVWVEDAADVPVRVLEAKLGQFTIAGAAQGLSHGTRNWGPTDPRTRARAHLQDLMDQLAST